MDFQFSEISYPVQANLGDVTDAAPDHCSKASHIVCVGFPVHISYVYTVQQSIKSAVALLRLKKTMCGLPWWRSG